MAPVPGELGPRRAGLPRQLAAPEHNIVQNPTLTRGVQLMTGVRQAHVVPALSEGLQTTLTGGDIRQDPRSRYPLSFASLWPLNGDGVNPPRQQFVNPPDHNRIVQLRRFHAFSTENSGGPAAAYIYYSVGASNILPTTGTKAGNRLLFGYSQGIAPQLFPPTQPYPDITERTTRAGWLSVQLTGINAAYFWRAPWFGTVIGASSWQYSEILEDFDDVRGPRIVMYPGSQVDFGITDGTLSAYFNMWWDEYPLT